MNRGTVSTPLFSFVAARSGTGKTTLLEKVIAELTERGYRVVTLKNIHQAHLDLPGKDSWRYRQAGALAVGLVTPEGYLIIGGSGIDPKEALSFLPPADLVLMEGFHKLHLPKVEVVRKEVGREIVSPPEELVAIATDIPDLSAQVPCFPLDDPAPLADWIIERFMVAGAQPQPQAELSHFDDSGRARMVDVSAKVSTYREAIARGEIRMKPNTLAMIRAGKMAKGDVLAVAQVAAVMAVKETPRLIPMCHPLSISGVEVDFRLDDAVAKVEIEVRVKLTGQTGVEMEALTGVSMAALTIYDMCKAVDKEMEIGNIRLIEKKGGRSGHYIREV